MSFNSDALMSVTTVALGEPVTFTCFFPDSEYSNTRVKWYKQNIGDSLLLMTTLMKATTNPTFEQGFPSSRFDANYTIIMSTLTILRTTKEDEAVYHCAVSTWSKDKWNGTYLSVKGKTYLYRQSCGESELSLFFLVLKHFAHIYNYIMTF